MSSGFNFLSNLLRKRYLARGELTSMAAEGRLFGKGRSR